MITVNRIGDQISGSVNGEPFSVSFDATKYEAMMDLQAKSEKADTMEELLQIVEDFKPLTQESYKELVETESPYIMVNKGTGKFYLQYAGEVSSKALPQVFADRIIKAVEKQIEITPLIKFWARWLRNPHYSDKKSKLLAEYIAAPYTNYEKLDALMKDQGLSKEVATRMATTPQVAITREGLMVGYKVSEEIMDKYSIDDQTEEAVKRSRFGKTIDEETGLVTYNKAQFSEERVFQPAVQGQGGDAFYCGDKLGHLIKTGNVIRLERWDQVDLNDDRHCVKGLHVGGLQYIKGYQKDTTVTHNVFIDPMHIGAICDLKGSDGAIRVKQYFPHSIFGGVNKQLYHSSRYAELTDHEYQQMVEEAVKLTSEKQELLNKEARERVALSTI